MPYCAATLVISARSGSASPSGGLSEAIRVALWHKAFRRQPAVQIRSFSGLRTAQMRLIRSPATSNAYTVTVAPSS
jgi:hypothetical protein